VVGITAIQPGGRQLFSKKMTNEDGLRRAKTSRHGSEFSRPFASPGDTGFSITLACSTEIKMQANMASNCLNFGQTSIGEKPLKSNGRFDHAVIDEALPTNERAEAS
jgi:hypothetical protein